ncbi:hypothetical protein QN224_05345 [Sinorhizobium sp. 8-89]|uniref:hypothetical protein n=1 Tax=Sinorhizobium sp. 7-81 TaxID=3049087 RepID=UPI0024C42491|nr:hypothetical protein [Sinorhizobium sp. 7-81]MDK1384831.1 hypothetical protein [Sinorhizobium sp. 7-81]
MITMRRIVGDGITATAIALLFAYLLLLQALLAGTSQGAMAAAAVDRGKTPSGGGASRMLHK